MLDFETWKEQNYDPLKLASFTEDYQYMIYEGDALLNINPRWICGRLQSCDEQSVYQEYIRRSRKGMHADCEICEKYRMRLYRLLTSLIAMYCIG